MSPKYKITYFDARGITEPIWFILSYMGEDFEDIRYEYGGSRWAEIKPTTPFGKLPIAEIDGKIYSQSTPLCRYFGKKAKLAGDNDLEDLQIDIIADVVADLRTATIGVIMETNEEIKKTKKNTVMNETLPFNFEKLEEIAKNNGGYLANGKLSWADFMFVGSVQNFGVYLGSPEEDVIKDYPTLKALNDKILSFPKVKAWVDKRSVSLG